MRARTVSEMDGKAPCRHASGGRSGRRGGIAGQSLRGGVDGLVLLVRAQYARCIGTLGRRHLDEVLRLHHGWPPGRRRARTAELTDLVGLDQRQSQALPRFLSGGQLQGPDEVITRWQLYTSRPSEVTADEASHAERLTRN